LFLHRAMKQKDLLKKHITSIYELCERNSIPSWKVSLEFEVSSFVERRMLEENIFQTLQKEYDWNIIYNSSSNNITNILKSGVNTIKIQDIKRLKENNNIINKIIQEEPNSIKKLANPILNWHLKEKSGLDFTQDRKQKRVEKSSKEKEKIYFKLEMDKFKKEDKILNLVEKAKSDPNALNYLEYKYKRE
jgi:hypothetical protein